MISYWSISHVISYGIPLVVLLLIELCAFANAGDGGGSHTVGKVKSDTTFLEVLAALVLLAVVPIIMAVCLDESYNEQTWRGRRVLSESGKNAAIDSRFSELLRKEEMDARSEIKQ